MLSWSSTESGSPADLAAIAAGEGDAGLPHGAELVAFAEAIARFDSDELAAAREGLVECAGEAFMIDAAAVAANFEMMTRVADGTGARHSPERAASMTPMVGRLGIDDFTAHR